jgi:hypothetical protein
MDSDRMQYARSAEFDVLRSFEGRVIEELRGVGQVGLPDGPAAECIFDCAKLEDGRVMAECHLLGGAIRELIDKFPPTVGAGIVEGHTADGSDIQIEGATVIDWRESEGEDEPRNVKMILSCDEIHVSTPADARRTPAQATYGLTNLEFSGDERAQLDTGRWVHSFRFQVASTEIVVRQVERYVEIVQQAKSSRSLAVTAEASLDVQTDTEVVDLRHYDEMMHVICTLMSLAKGNRIAWIYTKLWDEDGRLIWKGMPGNVATPWRFAGALIGGSTARELKEFVAHSYGPYLKARDRFNLPVAIGYYLASKSETEMYTKFLLACTAMETLVSNFAEKHEQGDLRFVVPEQEFEGEVARVQDSIKGALRQAFPGLCGGQLDDALVKVKELNRRSFRRVLRRMLGELGVDYDKKSDLQFIEVRHKVVHEGVPGKNPAELLRHYSILIELLDRILLNILQYEGEYQRYSDVIHFRSR